MQPTPSTTVTAMAVAGESLNLMKDARARLANSQGMPAQQLAALASLRHLAPLPSSVDPVPLNDSYAACCTYTKCHQRQILCACTLLAWHTLTVTPYGHAKYSLDAH